MINTNIAVLQTQRSNTPPYMGNQEAKTPDTMADSENV